MELGEPQIVQVEAAQFIGVKVNTSLRENKVRELWARFMPRIKEVSNRIGSEFHSFEVYPNPDYFERFDPSKTFQRWAVVKVGSTSSVPEGMEKLYLESGSYAVFAYRGKASAVSEAYQHIFGTWLPQSGFQLADRPHFCKMGVKYKGETDDSEEEIYIPISR